MFNYQASNHHLSYTPYLTSHNLSVLMKGAQMIFPTSYVSVYSCSLVLKTKVK